MIAAKARMRFEVLARWKICTNMIQGPALASAGRACLDPGRFIFTNLLREAISKVSKRLQIFDDRGLRDKANGSDLKIPFTPPHLSTHPLRKEEAFALALRVSDLVF